MDPFFNLAYPGKFVIDVIIDKTRGLMFDSTHHPTGLQKAFCKIGTHVRPFVLTDGQCWNPRLGTSQCDADRWIYPRQGWNLQKISYLDKMTVGIVYKSIVSNMKTEKRIKILHHLPVYVQVQISAAFPTPRRCLDSHVLTPASCWQEAHLPLPFSIDLAVLPRTAGCCRPGCVWWRLSFQRRRATMPSSASPMLQSDPCCLRRSWLIEILLRLNGWDLQRSRISILFLPA